MKRWLALSFLFLSANLCAAPAPIKDVLANARMRDKIIIQGTVSRVFDFDHYLVSDSSSSEIAADFTGVKQDLKAGDSIVIYGRFRGRFDYMAKYGLIQVTDWAKSSDPKAATLIQKSATDFPRTDALPPPPICPLPDPNIEARLRQLDDLKSKNLISPEEYQEQRKRILNSL